MLIRINRFFFDGRDVFIVLFGLVTITGYIVPLPVNTSSLAGLFVFLIAMRTLITQSALSEYLIIICAGVIASFFLSPPGVILFVLFATVLYLRFFR